MLSLYTKSLMLHTTFHEFPIRVKPEQCLDEEFLAWDIENEEWLTVKGWNCTFEEYEKE